MWAYQLPAAPKGSKFLFSDIDSCGHSPAILSQRHGASVGLFGALTYIYSTAAVGHIFSVFIFCSNFSSKNDPCNLCPFAACESFVFIAIFRNWLWCCQIDLYKNNFHTIIVVPFSLSFGFSIFKALSLFYIL